MSGVEIELSVEDGQIDTQDDDRRTENGSNDSRTEASTTTGGPSRVQGQWHCASN